MGLWDFFTGSGSGYKALDRALKVYEFYSSAVDGDVASMVKSALSLAGNALEDHSRNTLNAALQKRNAIVHYLEYEPTSFEEQEALEKMLAATNEVIVDTSKRLGYYEIANSITDGF